VLLAPVLCVTVFGEAFSGSVDDLRVLVLGAFGVVALKLLGNALTAQRRPGLASLGAAAALVVTVALDLALIPAYGGVGAAVASTLAYTAGGIVAAVLFVRVLGVRTRELVPRLGEVPGLLRDVWRPLAQSSGGLRSRR
jgi:O-antigen/teichoic acid export membrane protein